LRKELQHMVRELPKIIQMVLQMIIDAFYIYVRVDMDKKVAKSGHLHQRVGKCGWKDPGVTQGSMASCNVAGTPSARSATR
jgi:hypothetical protein